jgi:hypothetical protein
MKNQIFQGTPTSPRWCACPSTVNAGDLVLIGSEPACALNSYQANTGGATFYFNGTYSGTVVASSSHSPYTGKAINPGDPLYASGTLDTATNVTTGLLISATSTDTPFGHLDPTYGDGIASGQTNTAAPVQI